MKNFAKIFGIITLAVVIGFSATSCKDDSGGGSSTVSLLSAPAAKDVQNFEGTAITSRLYADDFFEMFLEAFDDFSNVLLGAENEAFEKAFLAKYLKSHDDYLDVIKPLKNGKFDVKLSNTEQLPLLEGVTGGKIEGATKGDYSTSQPALEDWAKYSALIEVDGQKLSSSGSSSRTINISGGSYAGEATIGGNSGTEYKISGIIKTEANFKDTVTIKNKTFKDYSEDRKGTYKVAFTLAFSCGGAGAKISFSASSDSKDVIRSGSGNSSSAFSDINFYGNDNKLICSIPYSDEISGIYEIASTFLYKYDFE